MANNINITWSNETAFRAHVLYLKSCNPLWKSSEIANQLQSYQNAPTLKRKSLVQKITRALKRKSIKDKPRTGAPRTVRTQRFKEVVKKTIRLKKYLSQRKVVVKLQSQNIKGKRTSVRRVIKELKLKPFKRRKCQKLTEVNKKKRVVCAKKLRKNFGSKKNHSQSKWEWNKVVNTDFSGIFTLEPFQNSKNDVVYAEKSSMIPVELREAPKNKFPKGIMFWGAISSKGLIPKNGPFNITKWLKDQQNATNSNRRGRMYMTGELYAKFLRECGIPAIRKVVGNLDDVMFQDDQDSKQRTRIALNTVAQFFQKRVEPKDCDAKFADVWPIENIWGELRETVRGKTFPSEQSLINCINKKWKQISAQKCEKMISKIPERLGKVLKNKGNQIYEH